MHGDLNRYFFYSYGFHIEGSSFSNLFDSESVITSPDSEELLWANHLNVDLGLHFSQDPMILAPQQPHEDVSLGSYSRCDHLFVSQSFFLLSGDCVCNLVHQYKIVQKSRGTREASYIRSIGRFSMLPHQHIPRANEYAPHKQILRANVYVPFLGPMIERHNYTFLGCQWLCATSAHSLGQ